MDTAQKLPVTISESDFSLLLVTPMPGIKAPDISITITGRFVKISGRQTGLGQDDKHLLIEEWKVGSYYRELELSKPVSGSLTNALFGNGILTLVMPKAKKETDCSIVTFQLVSIGFAGGERIGYKGIGVESLKRMI
ncbi:MAG: Hsp20/alpha crystallin family protein [Candidatus Binatia bacterium]